MKQHRRNLLSDYLKLPTFSLETTTAKDKKYIEKNIHKFTIYIDCLYMPYSQIMKTV